ncbi:hypothetical protein EmuJ_000158600 [Echinococcus multilocularis]|uniref:Uncharacterized protein n=1 Tax=Echinococcus multilocularis TaxID=6211 RepID=A0A087W033_ECHMU|nr:hypothetical protein EmuJ_000158600 [Echinococcus multilocularis]
MTHRSPPLLSSCVSRPLSIEKPVIFNQFHATHLRTHVAVMGGGAEPTRKKPSRPTPPPSAHAHEWRWLGCSISSRGVHNEEEYLGTDFGETRWDEGFCDALWYVEEERTEGNGRKRRNGSEATYARIVIHNHSSLYVYIYVYIGIKAVPKVVVPLSQVEITGRGKG